MSPPLRRAADLLAAALFAWAALACAEQLFVNAPGVHPARVVFDGGGGGLPFTVHGRFVACCLAAMLCSALVGLAASLVRAWRPLPAARWAQLAGALGYLLAWLVWLEDFISTAGDFG